MSCRRSFSRFFRWGRGWKSGAVALIGAAVLPALAFAQTGGSLVPLYRFTGGADGSDPTGGLVVDTTGTLYGETVHGGAATCTSTSGQPKHGCGTVYSFSKAGGLKVLVSFTGANGAYGGNTLTLSGNTLYGTTSNGGADDDGVVFSVQTDGTGFTRLHSFDGADGEDATGTLQLGAGNILYGVAYAGGPSDDGVLYSLAPDGTYTILHAFTGGKKDGAVPTTLLTGPGGVLVGSTVEGGPYSPYCTGGCGTLFEYDPATGQYAVPYFYGNAGFGGYIGSIGPGPTVYGNGYSVLYGINQATGATVAGTFLQGTLGGVGSGPILDADGSLIGVSGPGPIQPRGQLYREANGVISDLALFGITSGDDPIAQPLLLPDGRIIGTASGEGRCESCGTIWTYVP